MSNAAFAALDARIMTAFAATGVADAATYTEGMTSTPCTVTLDRDVQVLGEYNEVIGQSTSATFRLAEVTPNAGGRLAIGAETWTLEKKTGEDESFSTWILNNG